MASLDGAATMEEVIAACLRIEVYHWRAATTAAKVEEQDTNEIIRHS